MTDSFVCSRCGITIDSDTYPAASEKTYNTLKKAKLCGVCLLKMLKALDNPIRRYIVNYILSLRTDDEG